mmetsp:Transcript_21345/g.39991  ORF Transcript_21345/g.39991 Transcript_21345/m.39991 type:complete len:211 (-) Transcript_21345:465-1097(-)
MAGRPVARARTAHPRLGEGRRIAATLLLLLLLLVLPQLLLFLFLSLSLLLLRRLLFLVLGIALYPSLVPDRVRDEEGPAGGRHVPPAPASGFSSTSSSPFLLLLLLLLLLLALVLLGSEPVFDALRGAEHPRILVSTADDLEPDREAIARAATRHRDARAVSQRKRICDGHAFYVRLEGHATNQRGVPYVVVVGSCQHGRRYQQLVVFKP